MFNRLIILSAIGLLTLLLACGFKSDFELKDISLINRGDWSIVKSPLTGKCYETFDTYTLMGMAEVDCDIPTPFQLK